MKELKNLQRNELKRHEKDTGSSEVQVARLSFRIEQLTAHFQKHVKDHNSRHGLLKLVGQRKRLLEYLKGNEKDRYQKVILELGLRK